VAMLYGIRSANLWLYPRYRPHHQHKLIFQISLEGRCRGSLTVFFGFLVPGALLEALSRNRGRTPDGLQHGPGHLRSPSQGQ
jgi:hypothetical protein